MSDSTLSASANGTAPGIQIAVPGQVISAGQKDIQTIPESYAHGAAPETPASQPISQTISHPTPQPVQATPSPVDAQPSVAQPPAVQPPALAAQTPVTPAPLFSAPQPGIVAPQPATDPQPLAYSGQHQKAAKIYSHNSRQVWQDRRTARLQAAAVALLFVVSVGLAAMYWISIGSPANTRDLPLLQQLLSTS